MKKKLILWLISLITPSYTRKEIARINHFKSLFRIYFEGAWPDSEGIDPHVINKFGITNLEYDFKDEMLGITVTLERPGMLIGKAGRTIDGLNKWLEGEDMKIIIKESKIWKYLK